LPRYQPVRATDARDLETKLGRPRVFFFDRPSTGALTLASICEKLGAMIFFEVAGVGDRKQLRAALEVAHVVKYAQERAGALQGLRTAKGPLLEVETRGARGLRFRGGHGGARSEWTEMGPFVIDDLRDAAGAGDWCAAGIIDKLGRSGASGLRKSGPSAVESALRYGQALAAVNCGFEGARGGMYGASKDELQARVAELAENARPQQRVFSRTNPAYTTSTVPICPRCPDA
jgi:fructokinase